MDPKKVEAITAWPVPTKVKEVQLFLGLANFYRHFIDNFSKVAKPLHKLTRKDTEWKWMDKCQTAFKKLKSIFIISQSVLSMVDTTKLLQIESDASEYATGTVLECYRTMANGTLALIYQKGLIILNKIMMYMIKK